MKVLVTDMRHSSIEEERKVLEPAGVRIDTTYEVLAIELLTRASRKDRDARAVEEAMIASSGSEP